MSATASLLHEIDAFLARHRMSATRFGRETVNDGHLVRRLRAGGDVTLRTAERLRAFMAAQSGAPATAPEREAA